MNWQLFESISNWQDKDGCNLCAPPWSRPLLRRGAGKGVLGSSPELLHQPLLWFSFGLDNIPSGSAWTGQVNMSLPQNHVTGIIELECRCWRSNFYRKLLMIFLRKFYIELNSGGKLTCYSFPPWSTNVRCVLKSVLSFYNHLG